MSEFSRRHVLGGAAVGSLMASAASAGPFGETAQPPFGPALAPLAGAELPSFKFPLGAQPTKSFDGGTAKEATVVQFPVSEKLAGVYMTLQPGGLRELHWHANAAEWAYVIEGRCRVTTIDPEGRCEIVDFGPGDVWYFPRGHGHSIQGLGPGDCVFVLVFDNGYFSEFGTFSITDWIGHTPPEVLAKTFGVPAATFTGFPKKEVYIARGAVPSPLPQEPAPGSLKDSALTHRYQLLAQAPDRFAGGTMRTVSEREFPISATMTGALLIIKPRSLRELHWHPNAAEWQFYLKGSGRMTVFGSHGRARMESYAAGDVGYVPQGFGHYIENTGSDDLEVVLVLNNATYESVSITAWMGANPDLLLATNFGVPESVFTQFPKTAVIMPD
ncbi:MAG: cupin domain-containing protein [Methyloceanibacter sp.]